MANKYFMCKTNKLPHTYRCGEDVEFHIFFRENGVTVPAPKIKWRIEADYGFEKEGFSDGSSGELILHASLDQPGFIYVFATALDENGEPLPESDKLFGGAGVEIESIQAYTEEPAGYHEFWATCKRELYAVEPAIIEQKQLADDPLHPDHNVYDMKVVAPGGIAVSGILTMPKADGKYPARVTYQGYGVKSAWLIPSISASMHMASIMMNRRNIMMRFSAADLQAMALMKNKTRALTPATLNI